MTMRSTRPHHKKLCDFNEGRVPHLRVALGGYEFDAPVAIGKWLEPDTDTHGQYLYAIPGGGRIDSNGKVVRWGKRHIPKEG